MGAAELAHNEPSCNIHPTTHSPLVWPLQSPSRSLVEAQPHMKRADTQEGRLIIMVQSMHFNCQYIAFGLISLRRIADTQYSQILANVICIFSNSPRICTFAPEQRIDRDPMIDNLNCFSLAICNY